MRFRHPVPTAAPLGDTAMLVFCGRRHGLYANLTRFVCFRSPSAEERRRRDAVAEVEATAFAESRPGVTLAKVYHALADAYERAGFAGEVHRHHQGGTTGYLAREAIATPTCETRVEDGTPLAWNPSVAGAKIEDTVLRTRDGIDIVTVDPEWPTFVHDGRRRPDVLVRP
jgi:Xaa-Pro aminopeptidase